MKKLLIGLMAFASLAATAASFSYQGVLKTARNDFSIAGNATISGSLTVEKGAALKGTTTIESLNVSKSLKVDGDFSSIVPSGVIVMWSGLAANVPKGWVLCDGQNKTPDLRNRFIVGAGSSYAVGATGGDQPHENRPPYYALCFIMKQ